MTYIEQDSHMECVTEVAVPKTLDRDGDAYRVSTIVVDEEHPFFFDRLIAGSKLVVSVSTLKRLYRKGCVVDRCNINDGREPDAFCRLCVCWLFEGEKCKSVKNAPSCSPRTEMSAYSQDKGGTHTQPKMSTQLFFCRWPCLRIAFWSSESAMN